jgi:hypothetical protein
MEGGLRGSWYELSMGRNKCGGLLHFLVHQKGIGDNMSGPFLFLWGIWLARNASLFEDI